MTAILYRGTGRYNRSMPLFEYQCRDCEKPFEAFVTSDRKAACPTCGSENLRKMLSRLGMVGTTAVKQDTCAAPAAMCGAQGGHCGCVH
jgi:putative FmdB family regulatory protein